MEENKERIDELTSKIAEWQEELDTVWNGKNTDVAEVERRNLKNLINNAKREINELNGEVVIEDTQNPKELLEQLRQGKERHEREKNQLKRHLERLEEERENYKSKKNTSYKEIYDEYTASIKKTKEEIEKMEVNEKENKNRDVQIKVLTKGRMDVEKEINEIEKQIRNKQKEISEIEYGKDSAMEEKQLSDGMVLKIPKTNRIYQEIDRLREELKQKNELRDKFQQYINELKGIEKDRDDIRANDEYFGFEGNIEKEATELGLNYEDNTQNKINSIQKDIEKLREKAEKDPEKAKKYNELADRYQEDVDKLTGKLSKDLPKLEDKRGKQPKIEDKRGEQLLIEDKHKNLPVKSFWEIYNSTCTQHIGSIANYINKLAHMKILPQKDEDTLQKILNIGLIPFKTIGKVASFIPNKIMKTDKKIIEMQENIDDLTVEDFRVLVQSPEEVNGMYNKKIKDEFDRDYLDTQFMKQYKVNNAYLDVVRTRLGRENRNAIDFYSGEAIKAEKRMQELEEIGRENWTRNQEVEYKSMVSQYQENIDSGKKLQAELDKFDEGAKKKSSSYRNISGWFLARFNPDNREQNAKMAELSKARREASTIGDTTRTSTITREMQKFSKENTKLKGGRKNYIDIGKYSIESPVETLDRGQQNKGRLMLANIAMVSSAVGLFNQIKDNMINREMVEVHNEQLKRVNDANQNIQFNGEAKISDSPDVKQVEESITREMINAGFNQAERTNLEAHEFELGGTYHQIDVEVHANAAKVTADTENLLNQGDNLGALKTATDYYENVMKNGHSIVEEYISKHPEHNYTAYDLGSTADMSKVYDFFANGIVPYQTNINGTLAQLMPAVKEGVDLNAVIFAGTNALYQAKKEGIRNLRKTVKVRTNQETDRGNARTNQETNRGEQNNQNQLLREER